MTQTIYLVTTQTLSGECSCTCSTPEQVDAKRAEELERLAEHHPPEAILDAALARDVAVGALTPEEFAIRENKILDHGDRANYEFREVADALWEAAPARMSLEIDRCHTIATELGIEFVEPKDLTVESVRAAKAYIESTLADLLDLAEVTVAELEFSKGSIKQS